jgi:hypothetical protein
MGFIKSLRSKKDVTTKYWRLKSFSFNEGGTLIMRVTGYKNSASYASGAEAIDEYECIINNADLSLKTPFYEILEQRFPLFVGAEKDFTSSRQTTGPQTLTIVTPRGDLIQETINVGASDAVDGHGLKPEEPFYDEGPIPPVFEVADTTTENNESNLPSSETGEAS